MGSTPVVRTIFKISLNLRANYFRMAQKGAFLRKTTQNQWVKAVFRALRMSGLFEDVRIRVQREIANVYAPCTPNPDRITAGQIGCKVQGP
ncbi:MAG: hypothetical protein P4N60_22175 [Verrucomicrobiae bacterium]|nr:hypothetical protein [Verrucomicrobiae bacterium]